MPTCVPGWNLVPRLRTIMLPGTTISPPNFLTPSRRPRLSRPLRDEPPAFLCAICWFLLLGSARYLLLGLQNVRYFGLGLRRPCYFRLGFGSALYLRLRLRTARASDIGDAQHRLVLPMPLLAPV